MHKNTGDKTTNKITAPITSNVRFKTLSTLFIPSILLNSIISIEQVNWFIMFLIVFIFRLAQACTTAQLIADKEL